MKSSPALYELVHSLTAAEKRSFRLQHPPGKSGKVKKYMVLFDAVLAQSQYDEARLAKKMAKAEVGSGHFAVLKNYLYGLILTTLAEMSQDVTVRAGRDVQFVEVLRARGLFRHALRRLLKAHKRMRREENFGEGLHLIRLERELIHLTGAYRDHEARLDRLRKAERRLLSRYAEEMEWDSLYQPMKRLLVFQADVRGEIDRSEWQWLLQHPLVTGDREPRSLRARICRRMLRNAPARLHGDLAAYAGGIRLELELMEAHPYALRGCIGLYTDECMRLVMAEMNLGNLDRAQAELDRARAALEAHSTSGLLAWTVQVHHHILCMERAFRAQNAMAALEAAEALEQEMLLAPDAMKRLPVWNLPLYWYALRACLQAGVWPAARKWALRLRKAPRRDLRPDLWGWGGLLALQALAAAGTPDELRAEVRRVRRFFKKRGRLFLPEKLLLRYFRRYAQAENAPDAHLHARFLKFIDVHLSDPRDQAILEHWGILPWIRRKAGRKV